MSSSNSESQAVDFLDAVHLSISETQFKPKVYIATKQSHNLLMVETPSRFDMIDVDISNLGNRSAAISSKYLNNFGPFNNDLLKSD